jgi:23S rRNA (adenine2503-C2)-methyltransferase
MTLEELQAVVAELGMPRFAAKQIAQWIYEKRVTDIDQMSNLSKAHREQLAAAYCVGLCPPADAAVSTDGTIKYLFRTGTGKLVETVYIPDHERATLCVSSQMGCKMNCYFCMTGKQGFNGNLTTTEILNQIFAIPESQSLTNLVFMGMGEPLDNPDAVFKVLDIITAPWGMAWSPRRITLSTIGHMGNLQRFLRESECHLAVSLHSPYAEERERLMPVEKAWPIEEVLALLHQYDFAHQRHLTFEYIIFDGLNDSPAHARKLIQLLRDLPCKVNLIRFHAIPNVDLHTSDAQSMERFRDILNHHGLTATIRASRGEDIFAACGMLSTLKGKTEA